MSPVVVSVMANLFGEFDAKTHGWLHRRKMVAVTAETLDPFMASLVPRLELRVKNRLSRDLDGMLVADLEFKSLKDLEPDGLIRNIRALNMLCSSRKALSALHDGGALLSLFEFVSEHTGARYHFAGVGRYGRYANARWSGRLLEDVIATFDLESGVEWQLIVEEVLASLDIDMDGLAAICRSHLTEFLDTDLFRNKSLLRDIIDRVDFLVGNQTRLIVDDAGLKRLRATWRFLDRFLRSVPREAPVEVRVLPVNGSDLSYANGFLDEKVEGDWDGMTRVRNLRRRALRRAVGYFDDGFDATGLGKHRRVPRPGDPIRNILVLVGTRGTSFRANSLRTASDMALALNAPLIVVDPGSDTHLSIDWWGEVLRSAALSDTGAGHRWPVA